MSQMPMQQFTTYDIIVDTIPGAFLLFLAILLFPKEIVSPLAGSVAVAGVAILGAGYVLGRFIHTIGPGFRDVNIPNRSDTDDKLAWLVVMELTDKMTTKSDDIDETEYYENKLDYLDENSDDVIRYGQSLLYGENNLYARYEMLSTFFRNLYYISVLLTVLYFTRGIGGWFFIQRSIGVQNYTSAFPWWSYILGSLVGVLLIWISRNGWETFINRKSRAFFHDIHQQLDLENSTPPDDDLETN